MNNIIIKETSFSSSGNTVTVKYETDLPLTRVELTNDGKKWIEAKTFNQTSATFDISSWSGGSHSSCNLRVSYDNKNNNTDNKDNTTDNKDTKKTTPKLLDSGGAYLVDGFLGNNLDTDKWTYESGYVREDELQRYTNSNVKVNNGVVELRGLKDTNENWTSSSIITKGKFSFLYGKIEARIKVCDLKGSFGTFCTIGDSYELEYNEWGEPYILGELLNWCGEFDVMQFYNGKLSCGALYDEKKESGRFKYSNYKTDEWHIFAMEWKEDGSLKFTIDNKVISKTNATKNKAFHIPHYIMLNQAVGASGGKPDTKCKEMIQYIDWVKYYPLDTKKLVLHSSDFKLVPENFKDNNCIIRVTFNDNCINKTLKWDTSNPHVLSVHSGFVTVTSKKVNGTVTITATSLSGVSKTVKLTVKKGKIIYNK